jgi:hypothetical protein
MPTSDRRPPRARRDGEGYKRLVVLPDSDESNVRGIHEPRHAVMVPLFCRHLACLYEARAPNRSVTLERDG